MVCRPVKKCENLWLCLGVGQNNGRRSAFFVVSKQRTMRCFARSAVLVCVGLNSLAEDGRSLEEVQVQCQSMYDCLLHHPDQGQMTESGCDITITFCLASTYFVRLKSVFLNSRWENFTQHSAILTDIWMNSREPYFFNRMSDTVTTRSTILIAAVPLLWSLPKGRLESWSAFVEGKGLSEVMDIRWSRCERKSPRYESSDARHSIPNSDEVYVHSPSEGPLEARWMNCQLGLDFPVRKQRTCHTLFSI